MLRELSDMFYIAQGMQNGLESALLKQLGHEFTSRAFVPVLDPTDTKFQMLN